MRLFQLNFLSIIIIASVLLVLIAFPSFLIQSVWNVFYSKVLERDFTISLWQASLLWGALLTLLYMSGILKFKLNLKSVDTIDLDSIDDPELRSEIEKLQKAIKDEKKDPQDKTE